MALWSRATQIPGSCRCLVCGSRTIHRGARRPRILTVPSSAPAARIAIDARTRQGGPSWEEAIGSLREALHRPLERSAKVREHVEGGFESVEHVPLERLPRDLDWTRVTKAAGMDLADDQRLAHRMHSRAYDDPEGAWQELQWDSRFPGMQQLQWPANTGHKARPYNLPPQSLWAVDSARMAALRRRHTWKKLIMQELCTGFLIHSLLRRVNVPGWAGREVSSQIETVTRLDEASRKQARQSILAKIDRLHIIPVAFDFGEAQQAKLYPNQPAIPRYHQDPDGRFYETAQRLNQGLKELLRHDSRGKKDEDEIAVTVAKICHNLLVSSAPPDVQTFNILIAGFKRWRCPNMVDDAIQACLKSKIRPNEITLRNILGHYISEGRSDDFVRFVGWMRGVDDALMLANPTVKINEAGQGRLIRKTEEKVYQKVYPTPMVFGALIGGVMKFAGFERALEVYFEMKADGWGLDLAGLTRLLGDCVRRADWQGGLYVWEEISSIKDVAMPRDMAPAYEFMLSLCSVTGNTSAFNQLLREVASRGFDRHNILSGALRRTRWAQAKKENLAPAWAADNLLIAVSSFVKDLKQTDPSATPDFSIDDLMYGAPMVESDPTLPIDNLTDWHDTAPVEVSEQRPDQTETWASWVEAEFGERPTDPDAHDWLTATASKAMETEPDPTATKQAWETWLQAEFGDTPKDPKP